MSGGGANVTVTIGAAFAGSFKSVLSEADRELKGFGKRTARSMRTADRATAGLGRSVAGVGKASREAATAIGATAKELHGLRGGASHAATAAREMRTLSQESRRAARETKAVTAATVRGAKAQAQVSRRSVQPVSLGEIRETAAAMPRAYKRAVTESVAHVKAGAKEMRKAMAGASNGNVVPAMAGMPAGFGKATRAIPGVSAGAQRPKAINSNVTTDQAQMPAGFGKATRSVPGVVAKPRVPRPGAVANDIQAPPPRAARTASGVPIVSGSAPANTRPWSRPPTPPPAGPRTGSGVPAITAAPAPAAPWGPTPPPGPRGPAGGGRGRGAGGGRRGGGAARNAGGGSHGGVHTHDGAAIGGAVAGAFSAHTIWDAVKSASEMNDLQVLLKLQGRNATEIAEATQAAQRIAAKNPNISAVDAMKSVIDVADTGDRDMKKAARLAPVIAQSAKMVALVGDGAMKKNLGEDQSRYLGRALEDTGKGTKSEAEIKDYVNAVTAGTIATRGIFNPRELFQAIQKSGGLARGWSNEFTGEVMPALTMAMGGSGAGDAAYMFGKSFVKGQMQLSSAKAMMEMGLINQNDMLYDGKKYLGVRPDSMPNAAEFRTNQYDAFRNTVVPAALKKAGITDIGATRQRFYEEHGNDTDLAGLSDQDRKVKLIDKFKEFLDNELQKGTDTFAKAKNFSKQIADFIAQDEQIQAMRQQIRKQPKNATEIMMGENFTAQVDKLQSTFHTLMTALGAPEVGTAITAMDQIAGAMGKLAVAAASDPGATQKAMAGIAAVTAGIASLGTIALAGPVIGAMAALGPFGLAVGAVGAALAAWAVLDWDGFSEGMGKLLAVGQALKSTLDFLGSIGDDAKGNSLIGRTVSAMLGNNDSSNSEAAYLDATKRRDAVKTRLENYDPKARGSFPGQRAGLEDDLKRAEAEVKTQGDANIAHAEKKRRIQEREAKAMKMVSDADQKVKDATDRANAAKAMQEHAEHSDDELTKRVQGFKPKPPVTALDKAAKATSEPLSAENVHVINPRKPSAPAAMEKVAPTPAPPAHATAADAAPAPSPIQVMNRPVPVTITGPIPGTQGVPAIPAMTAKAPVQPVSPSATGAVPGAAATAGGKTVVDLAGPVSIKDDVGVKQPLRLATPVLVSAQGVIAVHDAQFQGTMSGLTGVLSSIAASSAGTQANTAAIAASCAAIAAKDFSPKITVNGGGWGTAGASRERASFSD